MTKRKPHAPRVRPPQVPRAAIHRPVAQSFPEPLEVPLPPLSDGHELEHACHAFVMGDCSILVGSSARVGWHLSIRHPSRIPLLEEVMAARYRLVPDEITMALLIPPMAQDRHQDRFCIHLWQIGQPVSVPSVIRDPRGKALGVEVRRAA